MTLTSRLLEVIEKENVKNVMMRIKNVGQLGRYQKDADENIKMDGLVKLCSEQFGVSEDYIWSHHGNPIITDLTKRIVFIPLREGK